MSGPMQGTPPGKSGAEDIIGTIRRLEGLASGISGGALELSATLGQPGGLAIPEPSRAIIDAISEDSHAMLAELRMLGEVMQRCRRENRPKATDLPES